MSADLVRPLARMRAWLITDGKVGMDVQARGVADALGVPAEIKHVAPRGIHRLLSPWLPPAGREKIGRGGALSAPWPDIAIATGRLSIPYLRAVRRAAGAATFTVILQDPKTGAGSADVIWVPEHDTLRGPNVITTPTAPHSFTVARFARMRAEARPDIAALASPRVAVILGGSTSDFPYREDDYRRLSEALRSIGALGASFLVTPSRRTHAELLQAADTATAPFPRIFWSGAGANPYADFLAHADLLVVTADSVNMTSEAAATGRPVYSFMPTGGTPKFERFHASMRQSGATRPLPDRLTSLGGWTYEPLDAGKSIAAEIERRFISSRANVHHSSAIG